VSGSRSRGKGQRGERELAALLTAEGYAAHRGRQYHGGQDAPDVKCDPLRAFHLECKRSERINIYDAMRQAVADAGDRIPVVAHRRNNCSWLFVLMAEDFFQILRACELADLESGAAPAEGARGGAHG
jgi:Holliday junction resolvase